MKDHQKILVMGPKERQDRLLELYLPMSTHSACTSHTEDWLESYYLTIRAI